MNESVSPVRPLVFTMLRPVNGDCQELRRALAKLSHEDAAFGVDDEDVDGQVIIRAMTELQLENICERLARRHSVYVESGAPNIIYLETIRAPGTRIRLRHTGAHRAASTRRQATAILRASMMATPGAA